MADVTTIAPTNPTWGELLGLVRRRRKMSNTQIAEIISRSIEQVDAATLYRLEQRVDPPDTPRHRRLTFYVLTILGEDPADWGLGPECLPEVLRIVDPADVLKASAPNADRTAYHVSAGHRTRHVPLAA